MSLSARTRKHTGQEAGGDVVRRFQILIFSLVKIYKRYLQTASASGGGDFIPMPPTGLRSWTLRPPSAIAPLPSKTSCRRH